MPDLTAQATTFRAGKYQFTGYLSTPPQTVIFSRAVNMASISYPRTTITFDDPYSGVGSNTDALEGMTVRIYSGNTSTLKGITRVANGGASATVLQVGEFAAGVIDLADNDRFDVIAEWRIWDRLVSATAALNKDSRIAYTDQGSNPPPVCNSGGPIVGFIAGASLSANFYGSTSFVIDPDSAGVTHSWDFEDGTPGSSAAADPAGVTFPAGFRWVSHTVTDSTNSKTATQRVGVWAHERTGANAPLHVMLEGQSYSHQTGHTARFRLPAGSESSLTTLVDGAYMVYWQEEYYGGSQASYGSNVANRSHIKFVGFIVGDSIHIDPDTNEVTFEALSPLGILDRTPALPQLLIRDQTPANWQEVKTLTVNRALWYTLFWHTTFSFLADFIWLPSGDQNYARLAVDITESIAAQLRDVAFSVAAIPTCDRLGRLLIQRDPNYQSTSDRSGLTTVYNLTTADWMETTLPRQHRGQTKFVRGEGITAGTTVAAQKPVFSNAPGNAPAWLGTGTDTLSKQIVADQAAMNTRTGMHYARVNGLYNGLFVPQGMDITLPDGYDWLDPAYLEWVTVTRAASTNKRAVAFTTDTRWLISSLDVTHDPQTGGKDIRATLDHETIGVAGVTYTPPKENDLPGFTFPDLWFPIGDFEGLTDLQAGTGTIAVFATDGVAITTNFSAIEPTWTFYDLATLSISGSIRDFTVDAFSPLYLGTGSTVNGWIVTANRIYRVTDIFGSIAAASQLTFSNAIGSLYSERVIQTERGVQNFAVVVTYYGNDSAIQGVYVTETTDGSTWDAEAALTTNYQSGAGGTFYLVPGVYVSGKAANTAYSAAMSSSGQSPSFSGYKTINGGSSWATFANPDLSGEGLPGVIHVPWQQAADTILYYSSVDTTQFPSDSRLIRATGTTREDITPTSGGNPYTARYNHGLHSCDGNRQLIICCGTYDNTPTFSRAVFVSRNGGDDWTEIVAPAASGYLMASIGGDGNSIYLLGEAGQVGYSPDFGVTILDKTGDLATYTTARLVNLCGG